MGAGMSSSVASRSVISETSESVETVLHQTLHEEHVTRPLYLLKSCINESSVSWLRTVQAKSNTQDLLNRKWLNAWHSTGNRFKSYTTSETHHPRIYRLLAKIANMEIQFILSTRFDKIMC